MAARLRERAGVLPVPVAGLARVGRLDKARLDKAELGEVAERREPVVAGREPAREAAVPVAWR